MPSRNPVRKSWQGVPAELRKMIPDGGGVYAIYLDGKLSYIGSSDHVRERLRAHFRWDGPVVTFWADHRGEIWIKYRIIRRYGDWLSAEARLLRRLQPILNKRRCA